MSWVQPQVLVSHATRAHLVMLPLALDECIEGAGAGEETPIQPKQVQRMALHHDPCSSMGPTAPVSTLAGHWTCEEKFGKASGTCALWGH